MPSPNSHLYLLTWPSGSPLRLVNLHVRSLQSVEKSAVGAALVFSGPLESLQPAKPKPASIKPALNTPRDCLPLTRMRSCLSWDCSAVPARPGGLPPDRGDPG